jgi:hypothetical protein
MRSSRCGVEGSVAGFARNTKAALRQLGRFDQWCCSGDTVAGLVWRRRGAGRVKIPSDACHALSVVIARLAGKSDQSRTLSDLQT